RCPRLLGTSVSAFPEYLHESEQNALGNRQSRLAQDYKSAASSAHPTRSRATSPKQDDGQGQEAACEFQRPRQRDKRQGQSDSPKCGLLSSCQNRESHPAKIHYPVMRP